MAEIASSYDVFVTTASIKRTSIFKLFCGYELIWNRVTGWTLWLGSTQLAGERSEQGLRVEIAGVVVCDSLTEDLSDAV